MFQTVQGIYLTSLGSVSVSGIALFQVVSWMDGWMDGWMDVWMDGRMDGRTDGWMDGWMDGKFSRDMSRCPKGFRVD